MPSYRSLSVEERRTYHREWARERRITDPIFREKQIQSARRWQLANPYQFAWNEYRKRARAKGLAFELSREEFDAYLRQPCVYCGLVGTPINGLDRLDNAKGYVIENIVTACKECNYARNSKPVAEFRAWIARLARFTYGKRRRTNREEGN